MLDTKIIKHKLDKQKLLQIYIPIIKDFNEDIILSYNEIIKQLRLNFNLVVNIEDIVLYYEPNLEIDNQDILQQINNLGVRYD